MPIQLLNMYVEYLEGNSLRPEDLVAPIRAHAAELGVTASAVLTKLQSTYRFL